MAAKKAAAKKKPAKAAKKAVKKPAAKKAAAKKPAARKAATKKVAAKKPAAKKTATRTVKRAKPSAKRSTPVRRAPKAVPPAVSEEVSTSPVAAQPEAAEAVLTPSEVAETAAAAPVAPPAPAPVDNGFPFHVGDEAPDFTLKSDAGDTVHLADLRGQNVVLYFYPRDNTPGCTLEGRDFSQLLTEFSAKNAVVFGISTDDEESHRHFKQTCELTVKLLADTDKSVHMAYGTWREKNNYGKVYWGTVRTTFLIDPNGRIARIWPKVRVEDHALDVLNAL